MPYIWKLKDIVKTEALDKFPELHPTVVQLLYNRGLKTQEQIDEFLNPDYGQDIHDPFLFKDMDKAVKRIYSAIDKKELITVFGDYDADGVCSAIILVSLLEKLGAKVNAYLPHREKEGYGLNKIAVENLIKAKTKLIITCDCGSSNVEEVDLANSKDIDVIITDHHDVPDKIPKALAIIHPKLDKNYPFKLLAGGGVAFKLAQALLKKSKLKDEDKEREEKWLLDLIAISTVADMMPLLGENRTLVKYGLVVLRKNQRLGLSKLIEVAHLDAQKVDTRTIAFSLAPRINAAGRMDHANLAYYLLTAKEEDKALSLANDLNSSNLDRQRLTEQTVKQAKEQDVDLKDKLLFFYQEDWPAGLTGLVAGRLLRKYNRPCIVMTNNNGNIIGSGRSIDEFNVTDALEANSKLLIKFGGHPNACGFTMPKENLDTFEKEMKKLASKQLKEVVFESKLDIELEVDFTTISWDLVDLLEKFQPFGQANPEPLFLSKGINITNARKVGQDEKHLKLELVKENKRINAIGFGKGKLDIKIGDKVDIVYNLNINEWNGNREIQLIIRDIKHV